MDRFILFFSGANLAGTMPNLSLLISRVLTGLTMAFAHGLAKMPPAEGFVNKIGEFGFPFPDLFAWAAALSEFLGGILLALGLATRPAALFILLTMFVAAFVAHGADPFAKKELALLYLFVCILFVGLGAGRYSLDSWLRKKL